MPSINGSTISIASKDSAATNNDSPVAAPKQAFATEKPRADTAFADLKRPPAKLPSDSRVAPRAGIDKLAQLDERALRKQIAAAAALRGAELTSLWETAATQAATALDRAGLKDVSHPTAMKKLPAALRDSLIKKMAEEFRTLWGKEDPGLETRKKAIKTLTDMAADPDVVFQAQYDRRGKLVSTSTIVGRDEPAFRDTGPGGTDRYGDHWVANVFTSPQARRNGHATAQIEALQRVARQRGWPHLWLYCRATQDGVDLPNYYRIKLGFQQVGLEEADGETEHIMRFDTGSVAPAADGDPRQSGHTSDKLPA